MAFLCFIVNDQRKGIACYTMQVNTKIVLV